MRLKLSLVGLLCVGLVGSASAKESDPCNTSGQFFSCIKPGATFSYSKDTFALVAALQIYRDQVSRIQDEGFSLTEATISVERAPKSDPYVSAVHTYTLTFASKEITSNTTFIGCREIKRLVFRKNIKRPGIRRSILVWGLEEITPDHDCTGEK